MKILAKIMMVIAFVCGLGLCSCTSAADTDAEDVDSVVLKDDGRSVGITKSYGD